MGRPLPTVDLYLAEEFVVVNEQEDAGHLYWEAQGFAAEDAEPPEGGGEPIEP